jgi:hypothetical protein
MHYADWYNNAVAVHRGSLVYALQLSEVFGILRSHGLKSYDYNVTQAKNTTIAWNSALVGASAFTLVASHSHVVLSCRY